MRAVARLPAFQSAFCMVHLKAWKNLREKYRHDLVSVVFT